jgi:hypothetical protein
VRAALIKKGLENVELEWMRCTVKDLKSVLIELRTGQTFTGTHDQTFTMRREQAEAVKVTHAYFLSRWAEDMHAVPRFLWNAKMRFGKTFSTYQLAKKLGAKRVLVVTFKPAVEDAWQADLENHADFDGWQYLSKSSGGNPTQIDRRKPVVYFGSFQDLLGRDLFGNISPGTNGSTRSIGTLWYSMNIISAHGGRPRRNCLRVKKKQSLGRRPSSNTPPAWRTDLSVLSEKETEFLPRSQPGHTSTSPARACFHTFSTRSGFCA